ncbi:MAG: hypothetical protein AAFQ43_00675 [Bacteroidota bacterium]
MLPDIRINASPDPHAFLREVERFAATLGGYDAERRDDIDSTDFEILNIRPTRNVPYRGLGAQLLVYSSRGRWADVEIRAQDWGGEPVAPSREVYVEAAESVLSPLLTAYNRERGTRRRLLVEPADALPRLPPGAADVFQRFASCANTTVLHPYDWERFYDFVRHCAAHNVAVSSEDVQRLLVHAGFDRAYAESIADVFRHGRRLLTYRR